MVCARCWLAPLALLVLWGCSRPDDPADRPVAPGLYTVELPVDAPNCGVVEVLADEGSSVRVRIDGQLDESRASGLGAADLNSRPRSHVGDWGSDEDRLDKSVFFGLKPEPMHGSGS